MSKSPRPVWIESLPARRLYSGDPDAGFGDKGVVDLPFNSSYQIFPPYVANGFYFAQPTPSSSLTTTITKLTADWTLDTTWGNGGRSVVPMQDPVLAYDKHTGRLYVAGKDSEFRLTVLRLTAEGKTDTTFGENGLTVLQTAPRDQVSQVYAKNAVALRDGGVIVAVSTTITEIFAPDDGLFGDSGSYSDDSETLVRFRVDGRRKKTSAGVA